MVVRPKHVAVQVVKLTYVLPEDGRTTETRSSTSSKINLFYT
jgi:hypothetical protein